MGHRKWTSDIENGTSDMGHWTLDIGHLIDIGH